MRLEARWVGPLLGAVCVGVLAGILFVTTRPPTIVAARVAAAPAAPPAVVEGNWSRPREDPTVHPTSFPVADAAVPVIDLWEAPGEPSGQSLDNPTWEGLAVVFLVLEEQDDWLHVRVSSRPNETTAWVRATDVILREVPNWIQVEVAARRVTVFHGDTPLLSTTAAVGRDVTPTPLGSYFVDGLVTLEPPDRAYGAGQVSISAFSPTIMSFDGGVGQVALHGTQATGLLGQAVSNGCVRVDNVSIRQIMDLAPTGTPVEIVA